jgi:hypothetical protein
LVRGDLKTFNQRRIARRREHPEVAWDTRRVDYIIREARNFWQLVQWFGKCGFIWQQDNAPVHGPGGETIRRKYDILFWPTHSRDLSPIELLSSIIKQKLRGVRFAAADQLFSPTQ